MPDPDPRVNGGGFEALRRGGIEVVTGLMGAEASEINRAYLTFKSTGRSFLRLKLASSLDGRLAAADGTSRWITSEPARSMAGTMRAEADAVMVGSGTAAADDPSLLAPDGPGRNRCRLIAAGRRPLPAGLKIFDGSARTLVAVPEGESDGWIPSTAEAVRVPAGPRGLDLKALLEKCASMGLGEILCEGGGALATSLVEDGLVDMLSFFSAPVILGSGGLPVLGGLDIGTIRDAYRVRVSRREIVGEDFLLEGRIVHGAG
jgi:diaminohydroxyphosphoribosylaminopyrimidine deaminase/5-amino-6-(5-phosphoribosylamino)uracil reductase